MFVLVRVYNPVLSFVPGPRLSSKPRKDKDPSSLRHAVDDSTGYSATPLAPTLAYVYPQLVSSATLAMNPAVAASSAGQTGFSNTKVREITGTQLVEQVVLSRSGIYWNITEVRTILTCDVKCTAQSDVTKFIFHTDQFLILHLQLQGFSTSAGPRIWSCDTRPFSSRELGGVWPLWTNRSKLNSQCKQLASSPPPSPLHNIEAIKHSYFRLFLPYSPPPSPPHTHTHIPPHKTSHL